MPNWLEHLLDFFGWMPTPPAPDPIADNEAIRLHELHNERRRRNGLGELTHSLALSQVAQGHADYMAMTGRLSHTGADGKDLQGRLDVAGISYREAAENVAMGQITPREVLETWLASPGHSRNILNPRLRLAGYGVAQSRGTRFWCAVYVSDYSGSIP